MGKDWRIGLVGANAAYGWGKVAHVPAIVAARGVTLHAVASRSRVEAENAAQAFGAHFAFDNPEELAACPEVDVVAVAVRAPAHRDIVLAALRQGKPVYCEWPLGVNLNEIEEMAAAAQAAAVPTAIGLQGRQWLHRLADQYSAFKVDIAKRVIQQANASAKVETIVGNVQEAQNAAALLDCDYIFLAADSMSARLLVNQIVHQYYIPAVQIGSKVSTDKTTGEVQNVFSVVRPVTPDCGCLWCNQVINPAKLQEEAQTEPERRAQRYLDESDVVAPSVITLNAVGAAHAANDFLFYMTGLRNTGGGGAYMRHMPVKRQTWWDQPRKDHNCPECGGNARSRLGRGDARRLNTISS